MTDVCPIVPLQVAVSLDQAGKDFLITQLERDIDAKARGWSPVPYTLFQLIEFDKLLRRKTVGNLVAYVLYTHQERRELAAYVVHNLVKARDIDDTERVRAYDRFLVKLLDYSSLLSLPI